MIRHFTPAQECSVQQKVPPPSTSPQSWEGVSFFPSPPRARARARFAFEKPRGETRKNALNNHGHKKMEAVQSPE